MLDPGEEWNVTQALRLAREIEQALSADADEDATLAAPAAAGDR